MTVSHPPRPLQPSDLPWPTIGVLRVGVQPVCLSSVYLSISAASENRRLSRRATIAAGPSMSIVVVTVAMPAPGTVHVAVPVRVRAVVVVEIYTQSSLSGEVSMDDTLAVSSVRTSRGPRHRSPRSLSGTTPSPRQLWKSSGPRVCRPGLVM